MCEVAEAVPIRQDEECHRGVAIRAAFVVCAERVESGYRSALRATLFLLEDLGRLQIAAKLFCILERWSLWFFFEGSRRALIGRFKPIETNINV